MEDKMECIKINEIEYCILKRVKYNNKNYCILCNTSNDNDFMVLREENDDLVNLDTDIEFDEVMKLYCTDEIF